MFKSINVNILNKANNKIFKEPINFTINDSEIWRIKGPNGIGKSSIYESLIGLRPIHGGYIYFNNIHINNLPANKRTLLGIKYIAQNNSLFNNLTIKQNLELFAEYLEKKENQKSIVEKTINLFNLNNFVDKYPYELSGGQQRLSELSKIMIGPNKLILLDEPFAAIDQNIIDRLLNIFIQLKKEGSSFLINDHNTKATDQIYEHEIFIYPNYTQITNNSTK